MYSELSTKYLNKAYFIILLFVSLYILDFLLRSVFSEKTADTIHLIVFFFTLLLSAILTILLAKDKFGFLRELDKRELTEEQLADKNILINKILDLTPDQLYIMDIKSRKNLFANRTLKELLGIDSEDQFNNPGSFFSLFHPDDSKNLQDHFITLANGEDNKYYSLVYRLKSNDKYKWFLSRDLIFKRDAEGHVEQIIGIATDITSLKETQIALAESEEKFKTVFYTSPDAVIVAKLDGTYLDVNDNFIRLTGFERNEVIGRTSAQLNIWVDPDQRTEYFNALLSRGRMENNEAEFRIKDGTIVNGLISTSLLLFKEEPLSISIVRDITDKKRAEEALRKKTEELDNYFIFSLDLLCISDLKGKMIRFNPEWKKVLGYSDEEFSSIDSMSIIHPDDKDATMNNIKILLERSMLENFQNRYRRKDGAYRWLEWRSIVKGDLIYSYARDVTEAKEAKDNLVKSERTLKNLISNLPGFVFRCKNDPDWTMEFISEGINDLTEFIPSDFTNKRIRFSTIIHEHDKVKVWESIQDRIKQRKPYEVEYRIFTKSGIQKWVWERGHATFDNDDIVTIEGFVTDITARMQFQQALQTSEIKHRTLVEQMNEGVIMRNLESRILYVNDKALQILGIPLNKLNNICGDNVSSEDSEFLRAKVEKLLMAEIELLQMELKTVRDDGQEIWIELRINPVKNELNNIIGFQSLIRDITERVIALNELDNHRTNLANLVNARTKELAEVNTLLQKEILKQREAELQITKALEKEKELSELKSRFINMASHEFRTPLATMYSSAELIRIFSGVNEHNKIELQLDKIQKNIHYLTEITDEVLIISRADTGKLNINLTIVDFMTFFNEVLEEMEPLCTEKHSFRVDLSNQISTLYIDPKAMRIVLQNLLSNAIKYSPGGGLISLSVNKLHNELIIKISDQGIGIPASDQKHIFMPFHRAGNVGHIRGTGLGLSISSKYIEMHNGRISFEKNHPSGTVFTIVLPNLEMK